MCYHQPVIVQYSPDSIGSLDSLSVASPAMSNVVNAELDRFEAEPGLTRWKRRAYAGVAPRTYGFDIVSRGEEFLVLWQQTSDSTITVVYIGVPI